MRFRVTDPHYALVTGGVMRRPGDAWDCEIDTLPEWDALHGAVRRGLVCAVGDSASMPAPEPVTQDTGSDLDDMTRAELWRLYDGDELTYRTATREALIVALRGE